MDLNKALKKRLPFKLDGVYKDLPDVSGIAFNSKNVVSGDLFIAVKGFKADGHNYIKSAKENGAYAVICEKKDETIDIPQIKVSDSRRALSYFSALFYNFPSKDINIIGVTGTNGKSTTCSIIEDLLEDMGRSVGIIGTIDYHYKDKNKNLITLESANTTPESMELHKLISTMKDSGVTDIVMEVSSHAIFLDRVSDIEFNTLVFTNITQDHLDFHNSMEEYISVKSDFIVNKTLGNGLYPPVKAIVNIDDKSGKKILEKINQKNIITFSTKTKSDIQVVKKEISLNSTKGSISFKGRDFNFSTPLTGKFNLENLLGASGAVISLGFDEKACFESFKKIRKVPGRLEQVLNNKRPNIFVDYAHTPDALENVLKTLRPLCKNRLICIFGCGGDRDKAKRPLMADISGRLADITIITSDNPRTENEDSIILDVENGIKDICIKKEFKPSDTDEKRFYIIEKDRRTAIFKGISISDKEDCILIAGKGHEDYQIKGTKKYPFDDRKTALEEVKRVYGN